MKILTIPITAAALVFLTGCLDGKNGQTAEQPKMQMPPLSVEAEEVKYGRFDFSKSYSALLKPFKEVNVVSRVSGILEKENFTEGAAVKEGDVLYEIQKEEYKALLDEAKAALAKAEANYKKASKDHKRGEYLFGKSAISEQQRDELLYAYESSQAELQRSKALVANAELNYGYTTIKAPISGVIGMSKSDEGDYIDADMQNISLVQITVQDPVYAEFSVSGDEIKKHMSQIKTGSPITIAHGEIAFEGRLDYIAPRVDESTDTLTLRAVFKNPNRELVVGSYVEVNLGGLSYERVAKIRQNALIKTPQATMVYVAKDGGAVMRAVDVLSTDKGVALIASGLQEGEKVIVSNIAKIRPNTKIVLKGDK